MLERQGLHAALLALLLAGAWALARVDGVLDGSLAGIPTGTWLAASIGTAVAHQLYVAVGWRLELHRRTFTRAFGQAGFTVFAVPFFALILTRPLLIVPLALANRGTLPLPPGAGLAISALLAVPALYASYSVVRYFGFRRAAGADHFDPAVAALPPVREGIYRWTSNAMYLHAFLWLWIPAFAWASKAALLSAGFQHAFIWVHAWCVEFPDLRRIHGPATAGDGAP